MTSQKMMMSSDLLTKMMSTNKEKTSFIRHFEVCRKKLNEKKLSTLSQVTSHRQLRQSADIRYEEC